MNSAYSIYSNMIFLFSKDVFYCVQKRFFIRDVTLAVKRNYHSSQHTFPPTKNGIKSQLPPVLPPLLWGAAMITECEEWC